MVIEVIMKCFGAQACILHMAGADSSHGMYIQFQIIEELPNAAMKC